MTSSDNDSESDDEIPLRNRKRGRPRAKTVKHGHLDLTSSLNKYVICNICGKQLSSKGSVSRHLQICGELKKSHGSLICSWCNLPFANRGNLASHAFHLHGDASYKKALISSQKTFNCDICNRSFNQMYQLTYHIRRMHFNLKGKIPYAEEKKVNQVWFEKVLNSNTIIEIKKTGQNTLVMKRLSENTAMKVYNENTNVIDLSDIYPTDRAVVSHQKVACEFCKKMYVKRDLKKHIDEVHYNKRKFSCNNCNRLFKRSYHYIKHVCYKVRKLRGVRQKQNDNMVIASVQSLSVPMSSVDRC